MGIIGIGLLLFSACQFGIALAAEVPLDCDIQSGGCSKQINGRRVHLEILPKPVKASDGLNHAVCT